MARIESRSEVDEDGEERRRRRSVVLVVEAAGAEKQQRTLMGILAFLDEEAKALEAKLNKFVEEPLNAITGVG